MLNKRLTAPFLPKNGDNFDKKYCEGVDNIGNSTYDRYQSYYKSDSFGAIFKHYTFANNIESILDSPSKSGPNRSKSNQFSVNNLLNKNKIKISEKGTSYQKSNSSRETGNDATPLKIRTKHNSMGSLPFNTNALSISRATNNMASPNSTNVSNPYNVMNAQNSTPYRSNEKIEKLPFIESKIFKNISRTKIMNSASSSNKLTNSSSTNSVQKQQSKFSTIIPSSSSLISPRKVIHKRNTSSNYFK